MTLALLLFGAMHEESWIAINMSRKVIESAMANPVICETRLTLSTKRYT